MTYSCGATVHIFILIKIRWKLTAKSISSRAILLIFMDNYLFYDGMSKLAFVKGNVELIDKDTHLYTDSIHYDVTTRIARYTERGRITNAKIHLQALSVYIHATENLFHFKDSVKIVNPDYVMTGDTMDYNTVSEIAYFTGPTEVNGDSIYLYCEKGWYDTKNKVTSVWKKL